MFVLHAGPHKTATTWLQANFHANHKRLKELGWHYPLIGERVRIAHHDLSDHPGQFSNPQSRVAREIRKLAEDATASGTHVLLSSEGFRKLRPKHMAALRKLVAPHPIHVVYAVRDPLDMLQSFWAQKVKTGMRLSLPEFVARHMAAPAKSKFINPIVEIRRFAKSADRLTILAYDEIIRQKRDILDVFCNSVLAIEALPKIERPAANAREPLEMTEFMRLLLRRLDEWKGRGQVQIGRAMRYLLLPATRRAIVTAVEGVPGAKRHFEVNRDHPDLLAIEARLLERHGEMIIPDPEGGKLFATGKATFSHLDEQTLLSDPSVGKLLDGTARRLKPGGLRMWVGNWSRFWLIQWRRFLKLFR